jgi:hypothetical protein
MQRDFVIQIRPDADVLNGQLAGRVEHIASGRAGHFKDVDELIRFVAAALAEEVRPAEDLTSL